MPASTASPSPVMTPYPPAAPTAGPSRNRPANTGQSLADLYNSRYAQEHAGSSTSTARNVTSTSLADIYNKRHNEENRKEKTSSNSLADLYNKVYEDEQQGRDDSPVEIRRPQAATTSKIGPLAIAGPSTSSAARLASYNRQSQPLSIDDSDEETPEPPSLLPSEPDELEEKGDDVEDDDVELQSTARSQDGGRSRTRSGSISEHAGGSQVVYVPRSSIPRRGALGVSAPRLHMDSDDEDSDVPGTPEPELPNASGASSNAPLARPHPSPSKLVVHSSSSRTSDLDSEQSMPPIGPHDRKGKAVQRLLESTQEEDSLNSLLRSDSASLRAGADADALARIFQTNVASSDAHSTDETPEDVVVISDSEDDRTLTGHASRQQSVDDEARASTSRSVSNEPRSAAGGEAVVVLPSSQNMTERVAEDRASAEATRPRSASASAAGPSSSQRQQPSDKRGAQSEPERVAGAASDTESDAPIITDARIVEVQANDSSSARATPGNASDSDMQRRYPKRARNVTDYNVKRIFERYDRAQSAYAVSTPTYAPAPAPTKAKKQPLPVVKAAPEFIDALRSKSTNKATAGTVPSSFADFLRGRVNSDRATAAVRAAALTGSPVTMPSKLSDAEAREITDEQLLSTALWNVSVRTDDRASLWQLKPSTRRWLGISNSSRSDTNTDGATTPSLPDGEKGPPLNLKLRDLLLSHTGPAPNPLDLRDDLQSFDSAGSIGRAKDAEYLESAARRIRLGRAYKLPLPDTLQLFADMEHKEWVRVDDDVTDAGHLAEDWKAREEGKIMVEVENSDWIQSQYDHAGRKRVSRILPESGGEIKMYFDLKQSEAALPEEEESQGVKIVRRQSPKKSPRLASVGPRREPSDAEAESDVEMHVVDDATPSPEAGPSGTRSGLMAVEPMLETSESPLPGLGLDVSNAPAKRPEPTAVPAAATKTQTITAAASSAKGPVKSHSNATKVSSSSTSKPASTSTSVAKSPAATKPKATTSSKGRRDLLSYFTTQSTVPQLPKPPKISKPASSALTSTTSTKPSAPPAPTKATVSASAKAKGKARARTNFEDADNFEVFPHSSLGSGSQVVVDLTHSSSASESMAAPQERIHFPCPSIAASSSKRTAADQQAEVVKKKTIGLGGERKAVLVKEANLGAEQRKQAEREREEEEELSLWNTEDEEELNNNVDGVRVELPALGKAVKRKRISNKPLGDSSDARKASKQTHPSSSTAAKVAAAFRSPTKIKPSTGTSKTKSSIEKVELPAATPSPTRNGWKGISGWYTNTRDAFSPTPDNREEQKKEKQARLDTILRQQGKHKHR